MYIIPYFVFLSLCFGTVYRTTRDNILTIYVVAIGLNAAYCFASIFTTFTPTIITHFVSAIIAYYLFDIQWQLASNEPDKWTFIAHHIVTIQLLLAHAPSCGLLPLSVGVGYLTYFEYSNTFLQIFQLCNKKGWKVGRTLASLPFVFTYVPLRLVAIPLHSLRYLPFIVQHHPSKALYLVSLIGFVDVFSMYFAVVVAKKAISHLRKGDPKPLKA